LVLEFLGAALNNDKDITGVQIESIEFLLSRCEILAHMYVL
jgi:hypothetical protein